MKNGRTYISTGDFIDLYFKVKDKGHRYLLSKFNHSRSARIITKWNEAAGLSDFWNIPEVRQRWNEKCTNDPNLGYESYLMNQYLSDKKDLKMLSVGCGSGARERFFSSYQQFSSIEGIDIASLQINKASTTARKENLTQITYHLGDFNYFNFENKQYDLILFNSSLHHFKNIELLLETKVLPLLKVGGFLVIFEYVGPNRSQWTKKQLAEVNQLLTQIPKEYKTRTNGKHIKKRVYRPGWLRMVLNDPSEAVDSQSILPAIHKHFKIIDEKKVGWDITHLLFRIC